MPARSAASWGGCFPGVFSIAKKVRTDTAIGENPVSVAFAAVDVARRIFTDLGACSALLVGAGETVELVTRHLIEAGVSDIVIANRTLGRARELAQQFGAEAVLLAEIPITCPRPISSLPPPPASCRSSARVRWSRRSRRGGTDPC
jgi:glutamyl-tRNA reductase